MDTYTKHLDNSGEVDIGSLANKELKSSWLDRVPYLRKRLGTLGLITLFVGVPSLLALKYSTRPIVYEGDMTPPFRETIILDTDRDGQKDTLQFSVWEASYDTLQKYFTHGTLTTKDRTSNVLVEVDGSLLSFDYDSHNYTLK